MKKYKIVSAVILVMFLAACYEVQLDLPDHIRKIYIPQFKNKTFEYQLEDDVTRKLREEFLADGRLIVVDREEDADAVINGTIKRYLLQPLSFDINRNPTENRIVIFIDLSFYDRIAKKNLWKDDTIYGQTTFSTIKTPPETESDARIRAAEDLANLITNRVIEGWETITRTER